MEEGDMPLEEWLRKESTGELAASGDFEVEALAAERTLGKKRQFLVKWKVRCCQLALYIHSLSVSTISCIGLSVVPQQRLAEQKKGCFWLLIWCWCSQRLFVRLALSMCLPMISGFAAISYFTQATWPRAIEAHIGFLVKVGGPQTYKPASLCAGL